MRTTSSLSVRNWRSTSLFRPLALAFYSRCAARLGLDHLVGTPALKPYMHGYFLSLRLYDAARVIANPFAYAEHREKLLKEKMEKLAETRIRTRKDASAAAVKVNKTLAERIHKDEEKERKKEERKEKRRKEREMEREKVGQDVEMGDAEAEEHEEEEDSDAEPKQSAKGKATLLSDPRFKALFEDPDFEVDEDSREFNLLNPSAAAQREKERRLGKSKGKTKTAVEEEAEESDKESSDGISKSGSDEDKSQRGSDDDDSSDAGDLDLYDPRARGAKRQEQDERRNWTLPAKVRRPAKNVRMVSAQPQLEGSSRRHSTSTSTNANASFGQRRKTSSSSIGDNRRRNSGAYSKGNAEAEFTWVPSAGADGSDSGRPSKASANGKEKEKKRRGIETFGAGLEKGHTTANDADSRPLSENERHGRTKRRMGVRSGSKNVFRGL